VVWFQFLDGTIELTTAVSSIVTTATTIGAFGSLGARLGIKGSEIYLSYYFSISAE